MGKILEKFNQGISSLKIKFTKKSKLIFAGILACIMLIIFINGITSKNEVLAETPPSLSTAEPEDYVTNLETRLENIISKIDGVGDVKVFVMAETSVKSIYVGNEDKSTNEAGETSSTIEIVFEKEGSTSRPVLSVEIYPQILGVLVVGEGLGDEKKRLMVVNATAVALNLENSKIEVLAGKNE